MGEFDFLESLKSLPDGSTSLILQNLTELGSGRIFNFHVRKGHQVQAFSLALAPCLLFFLKYH